jgi:outer membrane protein
MKRLLIAILALSCVAVSFAKDMKIGIINSEQILSNYDEYRNSMRILQDERIDWERQITDRQAEIEAEMQDFQMQENALLPTTRAERRAEIDRKVAQLSEFQAEIFSENNGRFFQRNQELMEPLVLKVNDAITAVAEEEGYDLLLDNSVPVVVYVNEDTVDTDLNQKVLDKLQAE